MIQPKRILLVDDDYDHLLVCSIILQKKGYKVSTLPGCEKMEELLETVRIFRPDLIFMDHEMRGMCGLDLIKTLKSSTEFARIPVIYFTGRDDIETLAKQAGADGYLKKPFEISNLIATTQGFLIQT